MAPACACLADACHGVVLEQGYAVPSLHMPSPLIRLIAPLVPVFALVAPPGEYGNALTTDMVLRLEMEETGAGDDASPPTERRCGGRASDGLGVPVVTPPSAPTVPSLKRGRGDRCCDYDHRENGRGYPFET